MREVCTRVELEGGRPQRQIPAMCAVVSGVWVDWRFLWHARMHCAIHGVVYARCEGAEGFRLHMWLPRSRVTIQGRLRRSQYVQREGH